MHGMTEGPCSACGREKPSATRFHAARLGGNPSLRLCDHCVRECATVIEDAPTRIPGKQHACDFCGKTEGNVAILVGIGRFRICDECVDAYAGT